MNLPHLLASLAALYDVVPAPKPYKGIIVALGIPPQAARRVVVEGGTPADEMHVTLAYLGNIEDHDDALPFLHLAQALSDLAERTAPLTARFGGPGKFLGVSEGDDAAYLSVDSPALPALREACVRAVQAAGLKVDSTHGFTPHATLAYQAPGTPHPHEEPVPEPFTFSGLGLWIGGNRVSFPFNPAAQGEADVFAKADAGDPRRAAQALLAQLGGDLARIDQQDRALVCAADHLHQHHAQAFAGLTQAIPAPRGSALEEAALFHAGEAAGARRATA